MLEVPADAAGSASTLGPDPRLAAQAQPAVAPAPARPASMARNRRRGRSGGLIGHTWSRSVSVAQDRRWAAAPYPPPCGGWMVTDPEMTRGWRLSAARRQFRARSRIAQSTLGGLCRLGVVWYGAALAPLTTLRGILPYGLVGIVSHHPGVHAASVSRIHKFGNVPLLDPERRRLVSV